MLNLVCPEDLRSLELDLEEQVKEGLSKEESQEGFATFVSSIEEYGAGIESLKV